jgi:hypothetical protein
LKISASSKIGALSNLVSCFLHRAEDIMGAARSHRPAGGAGAFTNALLRLRLARQAYVFESF